MAFVRVEQRNARLAAGVRIDVVQGKDGLVSKGTAVAISNIRKQGEEEATSIQWTFWGKLAESAAEYLGKGSRVNIVGRVQNNNYNNAAGQLVYGLTFTAEAGKRGGAARDAADLFGSEVPIRDLWKLTSARCPIPCLRTSSARPPANGRFRCTAVHHLENR